MYAIRNRKTGKWMYGTDHRYWPPHQRTSDDKVMIFESYEEATNAFKWRHCSKAYEIVPVRIETLED